jgi:hypothetical protein
MAVEKEAKLMAKRKAAKEEYLKMLLLQRIAYSLQDTNWGSLFILSIFRFNKLTLFNFSFQICL